MDVPLYCVIIDDRQLKDLQVQTFSGYKRIDVLKHMRNKILEGKLEEACHWAIELHISGHIHHIWDECLDIIGTCINIRNPKLAHWMWSRYKKFQSLIKEYNDNFLIECRNNQEMRNILADILAVITLSPKINKKDLRNPKINENSYTKEMILKYMKAKNMDLILDNVLPEDDDEVKIAVNEIAVAIYHRKRDDAIYWLFWLEGIEKVRRKNKLSKITVASRPVENVEERYHEDWIWFIWKICIAQKVNKRIMNEIEALFELTIYNFSKQTRKTKLELLKYALILLTESIEWDIAIVANNSIRLRACANINKLYMNKVSQDLPQESVEKKIIYRMKKEIVKPRMEIATSTKQRKFKIKEKRNKEEEILMHKLEVFNNIVVHKNNKVEIKDEVIESGNMNESNEQEMNEEEQEVNEEQNEEREINEEEQQEIDDEDMKEYNQIKEIIINSKMKI